MNVQLFLLPITLLDSSTDQAWPRTISNYFSECLEALPAYNLHDLLLSMSPKCSQTIQVTVGTILHFLVSSLQHWCPLYLSPAIYHVLLLTVCAHQSYLHIF